MLRKKPVKGTKFISVTFEAKGIDGAEDVALAGDFNDWDKSANPMRRRKDGIWSATVRFPKKSRHQYLFVVDGERWMTDSDCEEEAPNPFGGTNSVVST